MGGSEIDAVRALLTEKPGPVGWAERRERLDEVGSVWPVADDVKLEPVDLYGVPGEWSSVPGSDPARVLMFLHGGDYCSGSIVSHRRMVTEAGRAGGVRTLAVGYRLAPEHPFPAAMEDAMTAWRFLRKHGVLARNIAVGGDSAGGGLTVALINELRRAGEDLPGCALASATSAPPSPPADHIDEVQNPRRGQVEAVGGAERNRADENAVQDH